MAEHYLGIDWGTHSSKWCYQNSRGRVVFGPIWDSCVWQEDGSLCMFRAEFHHRGQNGECGLKRRVIDDPDQPFWEGKRPKLGATLGQATVFSLLCLLGDASTRLRQRGVVLLNNEEIVIRFSHPNWKTPRTVAAIKNYRDATAVALSAFSTGLVTPEADGPFRLPVEQLEKLVESHINEISALEELPETYDHSVYEKALKGDVGRTHWELVFESCAAGFPYLFEKEPEVFEGMADSERGPFDLDWKGRKILVIDIGAGSTDAGYMLRTIHQDPLLLWLPAAPSLDRAGNWLTERLQEEWIVAGNRKTWIEAEEYKTSGVTDWHDKQFAKEWCGYISEHVGGYIGDLKDNVRLPKQPALELVVTGGSSAVTPVREAILDSVRKALRKRGISPGLAGQMGIVKSSRIRISEAPSSNVQWAQFAVSLGASHPHLAQLKYRPEGL